MDEFDDFWDFFDDYFLTEDSPEENDDDEAEDEEDIAEIYYRRESSYLTYGRISAGNDIKRKKIAVMGYSGSGKTYVSNRISEKYKIPALHIEDIKYTKNWKSIEDSRVIPQIEAFMNQETWIIDGNYGKLRINERLESADLIILLLLPRVHCFFAERKKNKIMQRLGYKTYWCRAFMKYIMFDCRGELQKQFYRSIADKYSYKTVILRSRRQIRRFMK